MLELMPDQEDRISLSPYDLVSLKDAGIRGGTFAMRELDQENLESLALSDPKTWPPIKVTLSIRGYILIDGYHRWEIAKRKQLDRLLATVEAFASENDVIEAAFRANLHHGLKASAENRSDYAYWLHLTYPAMEQAEIAQRVGVLQSTVSRAIARREEELRNARQEEEPDEQAHKRLIKKSCKSFTRVALRFLNEVNDLDDAELMQALQAVVKTREDKARLARIGRLLTSESPLRLRSFVPTVPKDAPMPNDWAQDG
jgi:ParB-like chromosome segregation protein Spo0J